MSERRPVLVSCDDGWRAAGFAALIRQFEAHDVSLRAAAAERSWPSYGTATGFAAPDDLGRLTGRCETISTTGVDVFDCFPATLARRLTDGCPEAVSFIAGVNPGPNVGLDLIHSGTFGLAMVANWIGLSALAVSVDDVYSVDERNPGPLQFDAAARAAAAAWRLLADDADRWLVNINFPNSQDHETVRFAPASPHEKPDSAMSDKSVLRRGIAPVSVFAPRSFDWSEDRSTWLANALNRGPL